MTSLQDLAAEPRVRQPVGRPRVAQDPRREQPRSSTRSSSSRPAATSAPRSTACERLLADEPWMDAGPRREAPRRGEGVRRGAARAGGPGEQGGCVIAALYIDPRDVERFRAKVRFDGPTLRPDLGPCAVWMASCDGNGYGQFTLGSKTNDSRRPHRAHRVAWTIERGPIPPGLCVLHRCDNRRCVRVDHLFIGTVADNHRDMSAKGRANRIGLVAVRTRRSGQSFFRAATPITRERSPRGLGAWRTPWANSLLSGVTTFDGSGSPRAGGARLRELARRVRDSASQGFPPSRHVRTWRHVS